MKAQPVTLESVAAHVGVSKMTVSNAYNRPDQLSPALRARILATARTLGYPGPNPVASCLKRGKTGAFGLIFDDVLSYAFTDPAAILFLQGMAAVFEKHGTGMLLVPGGPAAPHGVELVRSALVDGFAVYSDFEGDPRLGALAERALPIVIVDGEPAPGAPWIGIDDRSGARSAARHLLDLGHRRFGIIPMPIAPDGSQGPAGPERQATSGYRVTGERLAAYRESLEAAGLDWSEVPVQEPPTNSAAAGRRAGGALLDGGERPTAILAQSDELAIGALQAAAARGVDVPNELSVVGFDDTPAAQHSTPPLTTVRQSQQDKGAMAARILVGEEPSPKARTTLPTKLVVRASSATPPPQKKRRQMRARKEVL